MLKIANKVFEPFGRMPAFPGDRRDTLEISDEEEIQLAGFFLHPRTNSFVFF